MNKPSTDTDTPQKENGSVRSDLYAFETGMYRPPSEGGSASLLVRLTRNCPWNHCTFCGMYKKEKFELRPPDEIIADIDAMKHIAREIKDVSHRLGQNGRLTNQVISEWIRKKPELYYHQGLSMLLGWLASGGKTVFLQDADSLIMKTNHLTQVLEHLRSTFPSVERITSYARSRTLARKPVSDLEAVHKAGLDRLHIGLESGDANLLKTVRKGATPEDHVKGGRKAMAAGFQVSEYWMPGLGGRARSKAHALHTAEVLNRINPHYIRSRPFSPRPGTIFYPKASKSGLDELSPIEQLLEIRTTLEALTVTSRVCFDHAGNYWTFPDGCLVLSHSYEGYPFPESKKKVLDLIDQGLKRGS